MCLSLSLSVCLCLSVSFCVSCLCLSLSLSLSVCLKNKSHPDRNHTGGLKAQQQLRPLRFVVVVASNKKLGSMFLFAFLFVPLIRIAFHWIQHNATCNISTKFHVNTEYNTSCQRTIQHSVSIQHSMSTKSTILHANGQYNTRYAAYRISTQHNVQYLQTSPMYNIAFEHTAELSTSMRHTMISIVLACVRACVHIRV